MVASGGTAVGRILHWSVIDIGVRVYYTANRIQHQVMSSVGHHLTSRLPVI